jgi:hypothetical protein
MALFTGTGPFFQNAPLAPSQIRIGFDPKSIREVISGCWGMAAYTSALAWRYSREVAFETYREIVQRHPRDTRFSIRQIQVNYTINNIESTRGEKYDYAMSMWIPMYKKGGVLKFRPRQTSADIVDDSHWESMDPLEREGLGRKKRIRKYPDPPRKTPYADPEMEQLSRARSLSGERHRGLLMPSREMLPVGERESFKSWSKHKTIFVFSNAKYERYLNYGGSGRPGKFYWELSFAQAVSKANQALMAAGGFSQEMITSQENAIQNYQGIVKDFMRGQWIQTIDPMF